MPLYSSVSAGINPPLGRDPRDSCVDTCGGKREKRTFPLARARARAAAEAWHSERGGVTVVAAAPASNHDYAGLLVLGDKFRVTFQNIMAFDAERISR